MNNVQQPLELPTHNTHKNPINKISLSTSCLSSYTQTTLLQNTYFQTTYSFQQYKNIRTSPHIKTTNVQSLTNIHTTYILIVHLLFIG